MENNFNNTFKMNSFLSNGRGHNASNIHKTVFKNKKLNFSKVLKNNGKLFEKEFNNSLLIKQKVENQNNPNKTTTKKNTLSWILNTMNPLNHLPIISTISKFNKKDSSLDMVQSAIGGAFYGGGPIGLAKGLGSWFVGKLFPKNIITKNEKPSNYSLISIGNGRNPNLKKTKDDLNSTNVKLNKQVINFTKPESSKINLEIIEKKHLKNSYLNFYNNSTIQSENKLDTSA